MARKKSSRGSRGQRGGLVERTFDEVRSSLDALRHLMDSYVSGSKTRKAGTKASSRRRSVKRSTALGRARKRKSRKSANQSRSSTRSG